MKVFSERVNYIILALVKMANESINNSKIVIQVKTLSETYPKIPKNYLIQLLNLLKNQGIVDSVRGKMGGYKLLKQPNQIRIIDVIENIEGSINLVDVSKDSSFLNNYWLKKNQEFRELFGETLQDLLFFQNKSDYSI